MIRRPPTSTLFPYTTPSDLGPSDKSSTRWLASDAIPGRCWDDPSRTRQLHSATGTAPRSEEHTSELQSQFHLVCRLLLEKKKKKKIIVIHNNNHSTS